MTSGLEAGIVLEKTSKDYPMFVQALRPPDCSPWCQPPFPGRGQPCLTSPLLLLPLASFLEEGIPAAWRSSWMSPLLPVCAGSPAFLLALLLLDTEAVTSGGRAKIATKAALFFQPNHSLEGRCDGTSGMIFHARSQPGNASPDSTNCMNFPAFPLIRCFCWLYPRWQNPPPSLALQEVPAVTAQNPRRCKDSVMCWCPFD